MKEKDKQQVVRLVLTLECELRHEIHMINKKIRELEKKIKK